jgi:hypothetical protein
MQSLRRPAGATGPDRPSVAARAGAFAFAAAVLAVLLALLVLAVRSPEGRSHQDLPLPSGGMTIEPGTTIEVPLYLPGPPGQYRLMVRCAARGPCTPASGGRGQDPGGPSTGRGG